MEWMEQGVLCVDWTEYTVLMRELDGTSDVVWIGLNIRCLCVDWTERRMVVCGLDGTSGVTCGLD